MRKRMMTEEEGEIFASRVFTYDHGHSGDPMKDVALYVLDLLWQGYTVKSIVGKLKHLRALAGHDHHYGDCITRFSQAIRLCHITKGWVAFHMQREPKAQEFFTLMQVGPNRRSSVSNEHEGTGHPNANSVCFCESNKSRWE